MRAAEGAHAWSLAGRQAWCKLLVTAYSGGGRHYWAAAGGRCCAWGRRPGPGGHVAGILAAPLLGGSRHH